MSYLLANEVALRALGKALGFESINTVLDPSNAETVAAFGRACQCAADDLRAMMLADLGPSAQVEAPPPKTSGKPRR